MFSGPNWLLIRCRSIRFYVVLNSVQVAGNLRGKLHVGGRIKTINAANDPFSSLLFAAGWNLEGDEMNLWRHRNITITWYTELIPPYYFLGSCRFYNTADSPMIYCQWSCIVGNVDPCFDQGKKNVWNKKRLSIVQRKCLYNQKLHMVVFYRLISGFLDKINNKNS